MKPERLIGVCAIAVSLLNVACSSPVEAPPSRHRVYTTLHGAPEKNLNRSCPDRYDESWDYFPEKVRFQHSIQLSVTYHRSYKVVDFVPSIQTNLPLRYVLYQCGTPRPPGFDGATFVQVPVQRAVLNSPSLGSSADALGIIDRLYGVNDFHHYTNDAILQAEEEGRLLELGTRGPSSIELAVTIDTDVVFLFYSANPTLNIHRALHRLGVGAVALGDLFESSPLGRAEWMKFFALFFNEEERANTRFAEKAKRYLALRELAARTPKTESVLLGYSWQRDTWTAPGGANFLAQVVRDAGGQYFLPTDTRPAMNLRMPFEKAAHLASGAWIWICSNGLNRVPSKQELLRKVPMFENFFAVRRGRIFAMDSNRLAGIAVPYLDSGLDNPDVLLSDVISVLHPELLAGYRPFFIREVL